MPSVRQYPHQWGWDAAYIALGWSWLDERRAAQELETLLRGGRAPFGHLAREGHRNWLGDADASHELLRP